MVRFSLPGQMARVRDSLLPCESMGIKDYSDYVEDQWHQSTPDEINGFGPPEARFHRVLSDDDFTSNTIKELVTPATLKDAYLRDWQSYDSGVLADIWVRTSPSVAQDVTYTGSPSIASDDATRAKTYTFPGGMHVHTFDGKGETMENANYSGTYRIDYKVSTGPQNRYIGELFYYNSTQHRYVSMGNRTWWYGTAYSKSTLSVTGTDTGTGSATLIFTPNSTGGSVTVVPYKPETVVRKVLQPASLNPEKTRDRNWCYYTRVPGSAVAQTKTFLMS